MLEAKTETKVEKRADRQTDLPDVPSSGFPRSHASLGYERATIGALIIRIGFWGSLYCTYNKEPPK